MELKLPVVVHKTCWVIGRWSVTVCCSLNVTLSPVSCVLCQSIRCTCSHNNSVCTVLDLFSGISVVQFQVQDFQYASGCVYDRVLLDVTQSLNVVSKAMYA